MPSPVNMPAKLSTSTVRFQEIDLHLHTSILPLYLWMEQEYLLTIKGNHHHVHWNDDKFLQKTEEIGCKAETSQQKWTHSVTAFPYKKMNTDDTDYKLKLGVHVLLPVSRDEKDVQNLIQKDLLTKNERTNIIDRPQVNMNADILTDEEIDEEIEILEKISNYRLVDGESAYDFCEAIFEDDNELECLIDEKPKTLYFNNKGNDDDANNKKFQFVLQYTQHPASCYGAIYRKFQKRSKTRFSMVDGQHRSLALFMKYCNLCPDEETTAMQWNNSDDYITKTETTQFRGKNVDTKIGLKLLKLASRSTITDKNELTMALVKESEKVAISNKELIGNSHVDRILKVCDDLELRPCVADEKILLKDFQTAEKYQTTSNKAVTTALSNWKKRLCKRVIENDNYIPEDRKQEKYRAIENLKCMKQINMQYLLTNTLGTAKLRFTGGEIYTREEISLFMFHMIARMDMSVNLCATALFKHIGNNEFKVEQQKQKTMYTFQLEHVTAQVDKIQKPKDLGKFFVNRISISAYLFTYKCDRVYC